MTATTAKKVAPFAVGDGDRPLPHNVEAERSVLGAILLDNEALSIAVECLTSADFFLPQHRHIFTTMVRVGSGLIDTVILQEELAQNGLIEAAGGIPYLSQLADGLPRVTNVRHYAKIVKEKAVLRSLIHSAAAIEENAFSGLESAEVVRRAHDCIVKIRESVSTDESWRAVFDSFEEFERTAPLSFAINGFLQNDGATMIGGLSGHGKTFIMLSIARALLAGKGTMLWNLFRVEETAARVLYLIPECARPPFKHRLKLFGLYQFLSPHDPRLYVRTLSMGPTPCLSDPRILAAAKGAHVFLDTAVRFSTIGEENSATDNQRGLAADIFALLAAGARTVVGAHHAPKPFAKESTMTLENVLRGSGDIGAMLCTAFGVKQISREQNIIHIENVKPRDFEPPKPFQLVGRPFIDEDGDFFVHKKPGDCGALADEQEPERDKGGASTEAREAKAANKELMRQWMCDAPNLNSTQLSHRFRDIGIKISESAIRKYKKEMQL